MSEEPKGFKWYVFKAIGEKKENDKKLSKGYSRRWQANNKLKEIKAKLSKEELNNVRLYVWKDPDT